MEQLIHKQIKAVMADLGPIAKDRKNAQQGYNFRGIDELMNAFAPVVTHHGIYPTVVKIEDITNENVTSKSGGAGYRVVRRYTFRFTAEDGSFAETMADGEAIDYGDKASNKAYSVAYREAIFKMFVIPFEDDDIEAHDHQLAAQTKPVPPKKIADAQAAKKKLIAELLLKSATDPLAPLETKEQFEEQCRVATGLELVEANYDEILNILQK